MVQDRARDQMREIADKKRVMRPAVMRDLPPVGVDQKRDLGEGIEGNSDREQNVHGNTGREHGIEIGGTNYLIPVDAKLETDRDVPYEAISLEQLQSAIEGAHKLKLIVLDACRNNPFASQMKVTVANRSIGRGLSPVEPSGATLVVYAAKAGTSAEDGEADDSPFALSFAKRIVEPGVEINKTLRFVRQDVLRTTGKQEPFVYGSLPPDDFYFVPPK